MVLPRSSEVTLRIACASARSLTSLVWVPAMILRFSSVPICEVLGMSTYRVSNGSVAWPQEAASGDYESQYDYCQNTHDRSESLTHSNYHIHQPAGHDDDFFHALAGDEFLHRLARERRGFDDVLAGGL